MRIVSWRSTLECTHSSRNTLAAHSSFSTALFWATTGRGLHPRQRRLRRRHVSDKTDPVAVKEEAKEIVVELVRAGFTVSLNRRGRLFRVQLAPNEPYGSHVDVHQAWFQDGNVWIHNDLAMPSNREAFCPWSTGYCEEPPCRFLVVQTTSCKATT